MTKVQDLVAARRAEVESIAAAHGGLATPEAVVAFAENPSTALHSCFEWDDSEAAKKYRLVQAAEVIRVTVTLIEAPDGTPTRIRAFVSLPSDRGVNGYRRTVDVLADPDQRAELLTMAQREYKAYRTRYQHLNELAVLFAAGDQVFADAA